MSAPRIEIDLGKIRRNTRCLVDRLAGQGIAVAGVTKAVCGDPQVAQAMLDGGASSLADARVSNVARLRGAGIDCPITLIRSPMLSEAGRVVTTCAASYNTGLDLIAALCAAARRAGTVHDIILMVEMGDRRDGILPQDAVGLARAVAVMPGVALRGIGANFACLGNLPPDAGAMARLSDLATEIEGTCGPVLERVSGGGSATLPWALGPGPRGRINELRLGEAILLGTDPVSGKPIEGLHTDAFTLVAEVIETGPRTAAPLQLVAPAQGALRLVRDRPGARVILALGGQDTNVRGLRCPAQGVFIGATSDHAVLETPGTALRVGDEIRCQVNYDALMRVMNARDVARAHIRAPALAADPPGGATLSLVSRWAGPQGAKARSNP
ncbi:MAG: alanine/ornithine racemase family PLP-dependent enzyme [Rhodobacteraceae bacterium]|nr:MAG: alanine/ornithine racemase family PLP-dependent enzyme [Paracoccaceae bacterium]